LEFKSCSLEKCLGSPLALEIFLATSKQPIGHPQGVFGVFSYYKLVMLFINMVCLTVASPWLAIAVPDRGIAVIGVL
jgi:hypothetical protein